MFLTRTAWCRYTPISKNIYRQIIRMATTLPLNEITEHLSSPSLKRDCHGDLSSDPRNLHILQWNILAQGLSNPQRNFVRVKNETVAFETRKWRVLEQILIRQPDVCSLEEADLYDCFLQQHLPKYGYTCFFTPKPKSPCFAFKDDASNFKGPDGVLLCYKTELFEEVGRYAYEQSADDTRGKPFFAALELKHKPTSASIVLVGTHLKAKKPFADMRLTQTKAILDYLTERYSNRVHVIVAGDFNGDPTEPFYELVRQAGFSSTYRVFLGGEEPAFTTWKFREHDGIEDEQCRTIDYIFYKPQGFTPVAILNLPSKQDIGVDGLPSNTYPSDHLAIEAVLRITS